MIIPVKTACLLQLQANSEISGWHKKGFFFDYTTFPSWEVGGTQKHRLFEALSPWCSTMWGAGGEKHFSEAGVRKERSESYSGN